MNTNLTNKLLKPEEMAELLGVSLGTLANWRVKGIGPEYLKLGTARSSLIRYLPLQEVEDLHQKAS